MLSTELSASLRQMAATFPMTDDEQLTLKNAAGILERIEEFTHGLALEGSKFQVPTWIGISKQLQVILEGK